jgi:hypothetical protein
VLEADLLGIVRLAEHRQRQLGGFAQHLDGGDADLDLAGRQVGVHDAGVAGHDLAVDLDHALGAQALDRGEARGLGVQHQLGQAVMVAQVDEDQAAVVALAVDPARQADRIAGVGGPQGAAGVGAIGVRRGHGKVFGTRDLQGAERRMGGRGCQGFWGPSPRGGTCPLRTASRSSSPTGGRGREWTRPPPPMGADRRRSRQVGASVRRLTRSLAERMERDAERRTTSGVSLEISTVSTKPIAPRHRYPPARWAALLRPSRTRSDGRFRPDPDARGRGPGQVSTRFIPVRRRRRAGSPTMGVPGHAE